MTAFCSAPDISLLGAIAVQGDLASRLSTTKTKVDQDSLPAAAAPANEIDLVATPVQS